MNYLNKCLSDIVTACCGSGELNMTTHCDKTLICCLIFRRSGKIGYHWLSMIRWTRYHWLLLACHWSGELDITIWLCDQVSYIALLNCMLGRHLLSGLLTTAETTQTPRSELENCPHKFGSTGSCCPAWWLAHLKTINKTVIIIITTILPEFCVFFPLTNNFTSSSG